MAQTIDSISFYIVSEVLAAFIKNDPVYNYAELQELIWYQDALLFLLVYSVSYFGIGLAARLKQALFPPRQATTKSKSYVNCYNNGFIGKCFCLNSLVYF